MLVFSFGIVIFKSGTNKVKLFRFGDESYFIMKTDNSLETVTLSSSFRSYWAIFFYLFIYFGFHFS